MHTRRTVVAVVALCALFVSVLLLPGVAASEEVQEPARPLAEMTLGASRVDWQPSGDYEHLVLTVAGPGELRVRRDFKAGQPASLSLFDRNGQLLPDGAYMYELRLVPRKAGSLEERALLQAGSFAVREGRFAAIFEERKDSGGVGSVTARQIQNTAAETEVIPEPLVVQGGACIGSSCESSDGPSDGLTLKSDFFTGIVFEKVAGCCSYSRDWLLQANPLLGGPDHFFIQDLDAGTIPFSVQGGGSDYTLVVGTGGNVGVGTALPAQDMHLANLDTPVLRLEDILTGSSPGRIWDIGANTTELFVKDVTNSSSVPFRVKAGAPSDSLVITSDGRVGIGTASPSTRFQVEANISGSAAAWIRNSSATGYPGIEYLNNNGVGSAYFGLDNAASTTRLNSFNNHPLVVLTNSTERLRITSGGNIGIGTTTPAHPLQMASGAHVTSGGVWTNASSRDLKHDIQSLEAEEARSTLARLEPVRFRYNADPADESLGFIAEDVPDLVATVDHKTLSPMDLVAVLTRVVQEQQEAIGDLQETITSLSEKIAAMEAQQERAQ